MKPLKKELRTFWEFKIQVEDLISYKKIKTAYHLMFLLLGMQNKNKRVRTLLTLLNLCKLKETG